MEKNIILMLLNNAKVFFRVKGLWFRVCGLGLGFMVNCLRFRIYG